MIDRAPQMDPVVGRETELSQLMQVLSRRSKNNPALIGEPGVGKTAVVEALAQRLGACRRRCAGKNSTASIWRICLRARNTEANLKSVCAIFCSRSAAAQQCHPVCR